MSRERIEQAKALYGKGDIRGGEEQMREVRYKLEEFLKRIK
jgi:hypothetical protein